jgi:hypothetical protein
MKNKELPKSPSVETLINLEEEIFQEAGFATLLAYGIFSLTVAISYGINMLIAGTWLFFNYNRLSDNQLGGFLIVLIFLPGIIAVPLGLKFAMTKIYNIVYKKVIRHWIRPLAEEITEMIWEVKNIFLDTVAKDVFNDATLDITEKIFLWISIKLSKLPPFIGKIIQFLINRTPFANEIFYTDLSFIKKASSKENLLLTIEKKLTTLFRTIPYLVFPPLLYLLIPVNIIFWIVILSIV